MEVNSVMRILLAGIFLSSCMKEEIPIPTPPHIPGERQVNTVELTRDYRNQVFFSLKDNAVVSTNLKKSWDLGFESSDTGWRIWLNSAKAMFVAKTKETDILAVSDTTGNLSWKLDAVTGHPDSTAIGHWPTHENVYVVDRGFDEKGRHQGFASIKFKSYDTEKFIIEYRLLGNSEVSTLEIQKEEAVNLTCFSFDNGVKSIQPPRETWDLLFTQYTYVFEEEGNIPYVVTGVLLNRHETFAIEDSLLTFDEIDLESAQGMEFQTRLDVPGYNWKTYNFNTSSYIIHDQKSYVIKTQSEEYYKLRFLDYYNEFGESGSPKFEFQRL